MEHLIDCSDAFFSLFKERAVREPPLISTEYFLWLFQTLLKEQEQYLGLLRQLKDYDEKLTQELAAKAYQEQEKQRLEVQFVSVIGW